MAVGVSGIGRLVHGGSAAAVGAVKVMMRGSRHRGRHGDRCRLRLRLRRGAAASAAGTGSVPSARIAGGIHAEADADVRVAGSGAWIGA